MKTDARTFAEKVASYPEEARRRAEAGESPISLLCWLSTASKPLQAAITAERLAFSGVPAGPADLRLEFVADGARVNFAAAAAPAPAPEVAFFDRPMPLGEPKPPAPPVRELASWEKPMLMGEPRPKKPAGPTPRELLQLTREGRL